MMLESLIVYGLIFAVVAYSACITVVTASTMGVRRYAGHCNNLSSKLYFLLLLDQARHKMIVYDDGNEREDGIYWDEEVIQAISAKIKANPTFTLRCLFNCPVPMQVRMLHNHPYVESRSTNLGKHAPRNIHMKIIDNGRMALLTRHEFDSLTQPFELVDCRTVASWALKRVAKFELEDSISWFEANFQQASKD